MTSWRFYKMAATASQIYFRFRIWQCQSSKNLEIYLHTKFLRVISVHGWDITTSGFRKQKAAILEFYFRFRFWCFLRHRHVVLHQQTKFGPNRSLTELWRHSDFQDGGRQPYWICSRVIIDHRRSDIDDPSSLAKFRVDRINNFGDIAIFIFWRSGLKLPIHAHF